MNIDNIVNIPTPPPRAPVMELQPLRSTVDPQEALAVLEVINLLASGSDTYTEIKPVLVALEATGMETTRAMELILVLLINRLVIPLGPVGIRPLVQVAAPVIAHSDVDLSEFKMPDMSPEAMLEKSRIHNNIPIDES